MRRPLLALCGTLCWLLPAAPAGAAPAAAADRAPIGVSDVDANKRTAMRVLLEKMGQGRFEISQEIYGPGFVAHGFGRDYTLAEDNASGRSLRKAFPDLQVAVDRIVGESDMVAVHWSTTGTNTVKVAPFTGSGRTVALDGMTFFRFANGKIVEEWTTYDNLSMMRQLGLLPAE